MTTLKQFGATTSGYVDRFVPPRRALHETELVGVAVLQPRRQIEVATRTEAPVSDNRPVELAPLPAERVYPHVFDDSESAGQAIELIRQAHSDSKVAIDAFGEADLEAVQERFTLIAAAAAKAYPLTEFNLSLGAVVSYTRRAALFTNASDVTRSALNALVSALQSMLDNPMLNLMDAAEITDRLSTEGWKGEHQSVDQIIEVLLGDLPLEKTDQLELFRETIDAIGESF